MRPAYEWPVKLFITFAVSLVLFNLYGAQSCSFSVFLSACVPAEPKQVHPQLLAALQARRITLFNLNVKIFSLGLGVRLIKHTSEDTHQKEGTACFWIIARNVLD